MKHIFQLPSAAWNQVIFVVFFFMILTGFSCSKNDIQRDSLLSKYQASGKTITEVKSWLITKKAGESEDDKRWIDSLANSLDYTSAVEVPIDNEASTVIIRITKPVFCKIKYEDMFDFTENTFSYLARDRKGCF